ncbi:MAG: hypothetical protein WAV76_07365 [Bacteroidota bacterium]
MPDVPKNLTPLLPVAKLAEKDIFFDLELPKLVDLHQKTIRLSINTNEKEEYYLIWSRLRSGYHDKWKATFRTMPLKTNEDVENVWRKFLENPGYYLDL